MFKNKKLIILIISIIVLILIIIGIMLIILNKKSKENVKEEEKIITIEELENNFKNAFYNMEYLENEEDKVIRAYELQKEQENMYDINVNLPKINVDTELARKYKYRNNKYIWREINKHCE